MACKMIFVLSVVVAVLYREMLFTDAQRIYDAKNGAVDTGVRQSFPSQGQINPGQIIPGQTFPYPNSAGQFSAGRPSTYDTLSMDVSKQVIRQLTPLAEVALSAPAAYGQAWAMAPGTAVRAAQPILHGATKAVQWG